MMDMAALVLRFEDGDRFLPGNAARTVRLVLVHEAGKRLTDDQADVQGQAGIGFGRPAGTVQDHDVVGVLQDQGTGAFIGDDLLQVREADLFVDGDQPGGGLERDCLTVIGIGEPDTELGRFAGLSFCDQPVDPAEGGGQAL